MIDLGAGGINALKQTDNAAVLGECCFYQLNTFYVGLRHVSAVYVNLLVHVLLQLLDSTTKYTTKLFYYMYVYNLKLIKRDDEL
jgi:hypothetical protein